MSDVIEIAKKEGTLVQLENTDTWLQCHHPDACSGEYCTMHNRSDHNMRSWPQNWRGDVGYMERICPHGIGHPDPDCYYRRTHGDVVHGCDGCCHE